MTLANKCRARDGARRAADAAALKDGQRAVIAALRRPTIDPAGDARQAGAAGEWGLIRSYTMMGSFPFGLDCATSTRLSQTDPLIRAYRVYSDTGGCETFGANRDCALERRMDGYAVSYNQALAGLAAYPYRDLCRPSSGARSDPWERGGLDIALWGFRPPLEPDRPRTVHEAARRGNLAGLQMAADRDKRALSAPDPYGMTPLAWAIAYRQPEAARWLVDHGAPILDDECAEVGAAVSPLRIALRTGQDELADWLSQRLPDGGRTRGEWSGELVAAAAQGGSTDALKRMLSERHSARLQGPDRNTWPAQSRRVVDAYERTLCWTHPLPTRARIEVISVYEGPQDKRTQWPYESSPVNVRVSRTALPVMLVLAAHDTTEWRLQVDRNAKLIGVLALGNEWQNVQGLPAGVPLVRNWATERCARTDSFKLYVSKEDDEDMAAFRANIRHILGRPATRLRTSYQALPFYLID